MQFQSAHPDIQHAALPRSGNSLVYFQNFVPCFWVGPKFGYTFWIVWVCFQSRHSASYVGKVFHAAAPLPKGSSNFALGFARPRAKYSFGVVCQFGIGPLAAGPVDQMLDVPLQLVLRDIQMLLLFRLLFPQTKSLFSRRGFRVMLSSLLCSFPMEQCSKSQTLQRKACKYCLPNETAEENVMWNKDGRRL